MMNRHGILLLIAIGLVVSSQQMYTAKYHVEIRQPTLAEGIRAAQRDVGESAADLHEPDESDEGTTAASDTVPASPGREHEHSHETDVESGIGFHHHGHHDHGEEHDHEHAGEAGGLSGNHDSHDAGSGTAEPGWRSPADPAVSPGFALLLRQLGFAELAANLLWVQMDADSHRGLWHRVDFALALIPALDPSFIDAYLLRAFLLDEYQGRHDEALTILEQAVKRVPGRIELWEQIGLVCFNHDGRHGPRRHLEQALEAFLHAADMPGAPSHLVRMAAVTLAAMGRREEAVRLLTMVEKEAGRPAEQRARDREMIGRIRSGEAF